MVFARILSDRQTGVWVFLVAATCATAVLGLDQRGGSTVVGMALLAIAFVKIRLVGLDFMEVRSAPRPLRVLMEAYVVVTFLALTGCYLLA